MTDNDLTSGFDYLMQGDHQVVVYGVLKRLHIRPQHAYYEDLRQEGMIAFAQKYNQYDGIDDDASRLAYLYQGVYWHLLDQLRKTSRDAQRQLAIIDNDDTNKETMSIVDPNNPIGDIDGQEQLSHLWKACSVQERRFIQGSYGWGMTVTEMSRYWQVSRKTVYQWKRGVQNKFQKMGNIFASVNVTNRCKG